MRNAITESLAIATVSAAFFLVFHEKLAKVLRIPDKIVSEKDRRKQRVQWREYVACFNSMIHALVIVFFGAWTYFADDLRWISPNRPSEDRVLAFSIGYFIADTYLGMKYAYNGIAFGIHHVLAIVLSSSTIAAGHGGYTMLLAYTLGEVSNPFMLTKLITQSHSKLADVTYLVTLVFCVVYLVARGPVAVYYGEQVFAHALGKVPRVTLAAACLLTRVSVVVLGVYGVQHDGEVDA